LYGAQKKVQLPFVMGVMADLSGKPADPLAPVADRKFLEIDVDNFDSRMKAMKPRVAFRAQHPDRRRQPQRRHHLREHGRLLAGGRGRKVDALNKLLEARQQLPTW
jgi:type VI secretion system protein ImpB